jgi:hypothetical protein
MELVFIGSADRADPFVGKILEECPRLGAAIRIAFGRVINISAYFAFPSGHYRRLRNYQMFSEISLSWGI